ncbi:hypothetical protein [Gallibacterium anatis]|uniref:hypothetical protein n=1 Tax=Gallibacterium anatis TaxID=750 RepID=UPI00300641A4
MTDKKKLTEKKVSFKIPIHFKDNVERLAKKRMVKRTVMLRSILEEYLQDHEDEIKSKILTDFT